MNFFGGQNQNKKTSLSEESNAIFACLEVVKKTVATEARQQYETNGYEDNKDI